MSALHHYAMQWGRHSKEAYGVEDAKIGTRSIGHVTDHQAIRLSSVFMYHDNICKVAVPGRLY